MKSKYLLLLLIIPVLCAAYLATRTLAQSLGSEIEISSPDSIEYYNVEDIMPVLFTVPGGWDWEADVDGESVESGEKLDLAGWSVGQHTLTVRAIDSSGQEVINTVTFTVNPLIELHPRILNLASPGRLIPCYMAGLGVEDIDPATIRLTEINGEELEESIFISAEHDPELTGEDGLPELMVGFDRNSFTQYVHPRDKQFHALLAAETVFGDKLEAIVVVVAGKGTLSLDEGWEGRRALPRAGKTPPAGGGQGAGKGTLPSHPLGGPPGIELKTIVDPVTGEVIGISGKNHAQGFIWGARAIPRPKRKEKNK